MSMHYELNTKTVLRWIKQESRIKDASKQSKHLKHQQKAMHPEMEEKLYDEYKKLCKKGLKVKGYWFKLWAQQKFGRIWIVRQHSVFLMDSLVPPQNQLEMETNVAQKQPDSKRHAIQQFHRKIRGVASEGNQLNLCIRAIPVASGS